MGTPTGNPSGRPPSIDQTVSHDDQGNPITLADRIVQAVRAGAPVIVAAQANGVPRPVLVEWLKVGNRALRKVHNPSPTPGVAPYKPTRTERRLSEFADRCGRAEAEWLVQSEALLEQLARGNIEIGHTTQTVGADGIIKTVTRTQRSLPDAQVIMWRLGRRRPVLYANRVELTGANGGPLEVHEAESRLAAKLAAALGIVPVEIEAGDDDEIVDAELVE